MRRLTDGRGVELVTDPLGGAHWRRSWGVLRSTGRLGMFGVSTASGTGLTGKLGLLKVGLGMPWFNPVTLMNQNRSAFGVNLGHLWGESSKVRAWLQILLDGVGDGWVRPHVDRTFALDDAGAAHRYLEERRNIGKVVLNP